MTYRKKLIEVALPLDAINAESAREKSIRHGHPSTLHLWWARRPLATCRAVIFASLVDDPSGHPDRFPTEKAQETERRHLFDIIEQLVRWENSNNEEVLKIAKQEIAKYTGADLPSLLDPFCGGGSIPLEAQRLGLEAYGSDLNPVPVLITKALIEIPPKFAGQAPISPNARAMVGAESGWVGVRGLAEDVRFYGQWMRTTAYKRIGHFYPKLSLPKEYGDGNGTIVAWLWARTVTCPNPACQAAMPLVRSFWLSSKSGKKAWIEPIVDQVSKTVRFEVKKGEGSAREGTVNRQGAKCICCGTPVPFGHIRIEGKAGRMGAQLMAIVVEGLHERVYLPPTPAQEKLATEPLPGWMPDIDLPNNPRDFKTPNYGLRTFAALFTARQLVALDTFVDLLAEVRQQIESDAIAAGLANDGVTLENGGAGVTAYSDAVITYLAFAIDKLTDTNTTLCNWQTDPPRLRATFGRQALPMTWDYSEANIFADAAGDYQRCVSSVCEVLDRLVPASTGTAYQLDAAAPSSVVMQPMISTDPPYYDNIGYADLSDFFYVWLRRSVSQIYPNLFNTMLTPKENELIASPYRFGGSKARAQRFFEEGLGQAFARMRTVQHTDYPLTIYYAFKQTESDGAGGDSGANNIAAIASTGWETMLEGLLQAGFSITGTWPMRTERSVRNISLGSNALASSIVLVCRSRATDAPLIARRDFLNALKRELPGALRHLQHGNIAPVDLAQATIGPGIAIFSRYSKVLEADGTAMRVRTALQIINQALDEVLTEQEGEFDADTRWALAWFEQFGAGEGAYGVAETLSKAKNTSISGLVEAGLLAAKGGKVRLLLRDELTTGWDPATDKRLTVWETAQHLIRALERDGENGAASLLAKLGERGQVARDLAYRLYTLCERKGWADEALAYNSLVIAWQGIGQLASQQAAATSAPRQQEMFT